MRVSDPLLGRQVCEAQRGGQGPGQSHQPPTWDSHGSRQGSGRPEGRREGCSGAGLPCSAGDRLLQRVVGRRGSGGPSHAYLLVEAAVDGAPADLHEALGGDEHLVDPLPWKRPSQAPQGDRGGLPPRARALRRPPGSGPAGQHGLTFVHARGRADGAEVAVSNHLGEGRAQSIFPRENASIPPSARLRGRAGPEQGLGLCQQGF